eukprot:Phypoly_transcript_12076.p1 GENE.Phypoly_transcript_12076~~Phypoly_transcript_12076.p1  ORF type:complete len:135 (-),score=9.79 Phypoly_transcript_12076:238-642(-)
MRSWAFLTPSMEENVLEVGLDLGVGSQVDVHVLVPREDDVEVNISNRELVTKDEFLVSNESIVQVLEFLSEFVPVRLVNLSGGLGEEGTERGVDLSGDVAEGSQEGIALWGSWGWCQGSRVLMRVIRNMRKAKG